MWIFLEWWRLIPAGICLWRTNDWLNGLKDGGRIAIGALPTTEGNIIQHPTKQEVQVL